MNIKDMPFVFAWLLCTVIALPLIQIPKLELSKPLKLPIARLLLLAIATAWLLSIRIAGVLIFVQYGCLSLSQWYLDRSIQEHRIPIHNSALQFFALQLAIFLPVFLIILILLYPVAWHNLLECIVKLAQATIFFIAPFNTG